MDSVEYALMVQDRLVRKFRKEFFEKTGKQTWVKIEGRDSDMETIRRIPLLELLEFVDGYISENMPIKTIRGNIVRAELVKLRYIYAELATMMGYSQLSIGKALNKNRSSISYILIKHKKLIKTDEKHYALTVRIRKNFQLKYEQVFQSHSQAESDPKPIVSDVLSATRNYSDTYQCTNGAADTPCGRMDTTRQYVDIESC